MASIIFVPDEVSEIILGYDDISIKDVVSFTCTCKRYQDILLNKFWEKKFYQRYFSFTYTFYYILSYYIYIRKNSMIYTNLSDTKIFVGIKFYWEVKMFSTFKINIISFSRRYLKMHLQLIRQISLYTYFQS